MDQPYGEKVGCKSSWGIAARNVRIAFAGRRLHTVNSRLRHVAAPECCCQRPLCWTGPHVVRHSLKSQYIRYVFCAAVRHLGLRCAGVRAAGGAPTLRGGGRERDAQAHHVRDHHQVPANRVDRSHQLHQDGVGEERRHAPKRQRPHAPRLVAASLAGHGAARLALECSRAQVSHRDNFFNQTLQFISMSGSIKVAFHRKLS